MDVLIVALALTQMLLELFDGGRELGWFDRGDGAINVICDPAETGNTDINVFEPRQPRAVIDLLRAPVALINQLVDVECSSSGSGDRRRLKLLTFLVFFFSSNCN